MKKTFIATAATLACAGAWAQVTLYGLADVSITHVSGYAQGSVTSLSSGHMEGSRWGVKGEEDMGGGYKALFTLESRVELDTGGLGNRPTSGNQLPDRLTAGLPPAVAAALTNAAIGPSLGVNLNNTAFDRQAWVGLVTPVGGFLMGRQYTPAFETYATFDAMNTQSALSAAQVVVVVSLPDAASYAALALMQRLVHTYCTPRPDFSETLYVLNQVDGARQLSKDITRVMQDNLGERLVGVVHEDQAVREALAYDQSVLEYDPQGQAADDLRKCARVLAQRLRLPLAGAAQ